MNKKISVVDLLKNTPDEPESRIVHDFEPLSSALKGKEMKEVHLVIYRESADYGYGHYDSVKLVTLHYDLATKHIQDNEHDYPGI
jgi:hypothetical protein